MAILRESGEDYLETILQLEDGNMKVRSVDVANKLGVTRPSVNKAISLLKEAGYVDQELYGNITLTDKGRQYAQDVLDRHHVICAFLVNVLRVNQKDAEADACRMEHVISKETFLGMKRMLEQYDY